VSYLLLIILFVTPAFAGLDKIQIKNLDFNYIYPQGKGVVEKVTLGIASKQQGLSYPVEVYRRDNSFEVLSTFIDFEWHNPIAFFHNLKSASTEKLHLKIDKKDHFLRGEELKATGEKTGDFIFGNFDFTCSGPSLELKLVERLKEDCLEKMQATVSHMELPFKFLTEIASQLPDIATETDDNIPANDFFLSVLKGDFHSYLRIKYLVKAYLKIWGHGQYENNKKTFAIRVDSIKFGVMPVTTLVMTVLRSQINHPRITINPPWIRIQLGNE
jgi:hypothetical protein